MLFPSLFRRKDYWILNSKNQMKKSCFPYDIAIQNVPQCTILVIKTHADVIYTFSAQKRFFHKYRTYKNTSFVEIFLYNVCAHGNMERGFRQVLSPFRRVVQARPICKANYTKWYVIYLLHSLTTYWFLFMCYTEHKIKSTKQYDLVWYYIIGFCSRQS